MEQNLEAGNRDVGKDNWQLQICGWESEALAKSLISDMHTLALSSYSGTPEMAGVLCGCQPENIKLLKSGQGFQVHGKLMVEPMKWDGVEEGKAGKLTHHGPRSVPWAPACAQRNL